MFVVLHVVYEKTHILSVQFSVTKDHGYAELFQYAKELCLVLTCTMLWRKRGHLFYPVWAIFFLYLFLDDALQIHEGVGGLIGSVVGYPDGPLMRAKDYGELSVYLISASVFLVLFAIAHYRTDRAHRGKLGTLYMLVALLVSVAGVVDIMDRAYDH